MYVCIYTVHAYINTRLILIFAFVFIDIYLYIDISCHVYTENGRYFPLNEIYAITVIYTSRLVWDNSPALSLDWPQVCCRCGSHHQDETLVTRPMHDMFRFVHEIYSRVIWMISNWNNISRTHGEFLFIDQDFTFSTFVLTMLECWNTWGSVCKHLVTENPSIP